jgi:uncharacterized membrane protein
LDKETVDLFRDIGGDIKVVVSDIASGLGVAVERVYYVLIRQQFVEGISSIITSILVCSLLVWLAFFYFKKLILSVDPEERKKRFENNVPFIFIGIGGMVLALVTFVVVLVNIHTVSSDIGKMINPEYYALEKIMEMIRGSNSSNN